MTTERGNKKVQDYCRDERIQKEPKRTKIGSRVMFNLHKKRSVSCVGEVCLTPDWEGKWRARVAWVWNFPIAIIIWRKKKLCWRDWPDHSSLMLSSPLKSADSRESPGVAKLTLKRPVEWIKYNLRLTNFPSCVQKCRFSCTSSMDKGVALWLQGRVCGN